MATKAPHDMQKIGDYLGAAADARRNDTDQAFRQPGSLAPGGLSVVVPLARLTAAGAAGSLTFTGGLLTGYVAPT